jgi:hypothetical protein
VGYRGGSDRGLRAEVVEEDERVVLSGARVGVVGDEVLAGCADELHDLVAEGEVADVGVVEGLAAVGVAADVVALPQAREVGALDEELADEVGQVGCVGFGGS